MIPTSCVCKAGFVTQREREHGPLEHVSSEIEHAVVGYIQKKIPGSTSGCEGKYLEGEYPDSETRKDESGDENCRNGQPGSLSLSLSFFFFFYLKVFIAFA